MPRIFQWFCMGHPSHSSRHKRTLKPFCSIEKQRNSRPSIVWPMNHRVNDLRGCEFYLYIYIYFGGSWVNNAREDQTSVYSTRQLVDINSPVIARMSVLPKSPKFDCSVEHWWENVPKARALQAGWNYSCCSLLQTKRNMQAGLRVRRRSL